MAGSLEKILFALTDRLHSHAERQKNSAFVWMASVPNNYRLKTNPQEKNSRSKLFRARLAALLQERGVSQRELATAIQLSPGAVSNYLSGGRTLPRAEELLALARYFSVSVEWLLGEDAGSGSDGDRKPAPPPKTHQKATELRAVVRQLKRLVDRLEDLLGDR